MGRGLPYQIVIASYTDRALEVGRAYSQTKENMMELLLILIAIGIGGYLFIRGNIKRGTETVRAYVYIGCIANGRTTEEANEAARADISNGPTEIIRAAMNEVKYKYDGKQLSLIRKAYTLGMIPYR